MTNLNKAVKLWTELISNDLNKPALSSNDLNINTFDIELKNILEMNIDNAVPFIMIREQLNNYMDKKSFSLNNMLTNWGELNSHLDKCKELLNIITEQSVINLENEYKNIYKLALQRCDIDTKDIDSLISNSNMLVNSNVAALKSIEELKVNQFATGKPSKAIVKYNNSVYCCNNLSALLSTVKTNTSFDGITLSYISDNRRPFSSYFAFIIKNGENIYLITDKPTLAHPAQHNMATCNEKDFRIRANSNKFPYVMFSSIINKVPCDFYPVCEFKDLTLDEVLWIISMFSIIETKYFKKDIQLELSYTSETIDKLSSNKFVLDNSYYDLIENTWNRKSTYYNEWLLYRYKDKISPNLLNMSDNNVITYFDSGEEKNMELDKYELLSSYTKDRILRKSFLKTPLCDFGSKEYLENNRTFINRYNTANIVRYYAEEEFKDRKEEVDLWFKNQLNKSKENLLKSIGIGEFKSIVVKNYSFSEKGRDILRQGLPLDYSDKSCFSKDSDISEENIMSLHLYDNCKYSTNHSLAYKIANGEYEDKCCISGGTPTVVASFKANNVNSLMDLFNCSFDELPDVIKYWTSEKKLCYTNTLSGNMDPMDWVVENVWASEKFVVDVLLSKTAYNNLVKEANRPLNKFWLSNN